MNRFFEIRRYRTPNNKVPISDWIHELDNVEAARIMAHIDRIKTGNFGNSRSVGGGVSELKINFGPGYRVYYLRDGGAVVILLCGGDKGSQATDILRAQRYAEDYWRQK